MIPFAADLAPEERRGRVVARIMTGLLLGILLARTVSGLVAQAAGWRAIYWLSAALMVCFAVVLWRALPGRAARVRTAATPSWSARRSASSSRSPCSAAGPGTEPVPSPPSACCGPRSPSCSRGVPTTTPMPVIGLFGLVGAGGIVAANLAGKLADSARVTATTVGAGVLLAGSFALLWVGRTSLAALIVGIVVLDIGTQGMQITNQAVIYALRPDARSRINSAYMVCYFLGGAVGSLAAGALYAAHGWAGVCLLGAGFGVLTLGHVGLRRPAPPGREGHRQAGAVGSGAVRDVGPARGPGRVPRCRLTCSHRSGSGLALSMILSWLPSWSRKANMAGTPGQRSSSSTSTPLETSDAWSASASAVARVIPCPRPPGPRRRRPRARWEPCPQGQRPAPIVRRLPAGRRGEPRTRTCRRRSERLEPGLRPGRRPLPRPRPSSAWHSSVGSFVSSSLALRFPCDDAVRRTAATRAW